jgi:hypothetical protein
MDGPGFVKETPRPAFRRAAACALALLVTSSAPALASVTADTAIAVAPRVATAAPAASPRRLRA